MDLAKVFVGDVSIDLRRTNIGVTKKCLDGTEIGTVAKKIRREAVANDVRCHLASNAGFGGIGF